MVKYTKFSTTSQIWNKNISEIWMETMNEFLDINTALVAFENAAIAHGTAIENGKYKIANKSHAQIEKVVNFLKEQSKLKSLQIFLDHNSIGVKTWAATYLLSTIEEEAVKVLEEIAQGSDMRAFAAETTLSEWRKGNLKL